MTAIEELIKQYEPKTIEETKMALRELLQEIVLIGLSRGDFFSHASFYGGTALRIFYSLNRYSEDLDFTLNEKNELFSIIPYIKKIQEVALSYGLDIDIQTKEKKIETAIESAFAKLNTYQTFIKLNLDALNIKSLHKDEVIKVKFEIDCNPSLGFIIESKWISSPEFARVNVLDLSSLFAGKIHAILCRTYKSNVKGRDYYDFLFYIKKNVKPNMNYLKNKLIESKKLDFDSKFDNEILKKMLKEKFESVDFNQVRDDAQRFVYHGEDLSYYSKELFIDMINKLD